MTTSTSETGLFGALLRQHRLAASLSQEQLGERAQLSVNAIAALERGRRNAPRPGTVALLADALRLTPAERAALISAAAPARLDGLAKPDDLSTRGGRGGRVALDAAAAVRTTGELPTGTVTFLFTDIEGSTRLWDQYPKEARDALARHDTLLEALVLKHAGEVVRPRGEGDSRFAVFPRASDAVSAACAIQQAFLAELWPASTPLRVRMALHTGEADLREDDYYGGAVNRCARLRAIAHGGQTLLSGITAELVRDGLPDGTALLDLGIHRLKDLSAPERVFQLLHSALPANFPSLNSLSAQRDNLPIQLSSFVGRERELDDLKPLLATTRLVTLTGVGGVGKTRLALQVAAELLGEYPDGVYLVELASLADPALVPQAVAGTLGIREQPGQPLLVVLVDVLQSRQLLLILDNCEHVVDACAHLVDRLLRECPPLRVLATSREALGITGETVWSIPPLSLPETPAPAAELFNQSEAVRLFTERCQAVQANFVLTERNAVAVAEVCRRLDGLPLALELAAARVTVLGVEQIAERLEGQLRLLTGGSRTAAPRQQTLRGAIEWSYRLLSDQERLLFDGLSVFAGSFSLEAAEAVCTTDGLEADQLLDLLQRLVGKSLLAVANAPDGTSARLRMLEPLRHYARERLAATDAADRVSARHATFFAELVEEAGTHAHGPRQVEYLKRLEQEHDNIRGALGYLLERKEGSTALRFASMSLLWSARGYWSEGRAWLERALALPEQDGAHSARAMALLWVAELAWLQGDMPGAKQHAFDCLAASQNADVHSTAASAMGFLGMLSWIQGDHAAARPLIDQSLALSREMGDHWLTARMLGLLGVVALQADDLESARARVEESVTLAREAGDTYSLTIALNFVGDVKRVQGADDDAEAAYTESLVLNDTMGDFGQGATCLHNLGYLAQARGDLARATSMFAESLARVRQRGEKRGVAECLIGFAGIARVYGQPERAAQLFGAAEATLESIGRQSGSPTGLTTIASSRPCAAI